MNDYQKHIISYLPYGLNIKILNHKCDYVGIEKSIANGYYMLNNEIHITYEGGSTGKSIKDFKPLLIPLSKLTEEIEHKGETFIPIKKLEQMLFDYEFECNWLWGDIAIRLNKVNTPNSLPYVIVQYLLEWHFDIYGMIEKGQAIEK